MRSFTLMAGSLLLWGLVACDPDTTADRADPAPPPTPTPAEEAAAPDDQPEMKEDEASDFAYNPIGKRDPFRSFFHSGPDRTISSPTPLQRFEVDEYRLVGIVWGISNPRAMVEDPENVGHVIEVGTYIGKNWGKVTQINSGSVIITEEYQTIDGELVTNEIVLELPVEEFSQ